MGQAQGGGLFSAPDQNTIGPMTWASMGGVDASSPLVGGPGSMSGSATNDRRVAVGAVDPTPASGGSAGGYKELLNFKGSPLPWILIAAIAYLGLAHLSISGAVGVGK